MFNEVRLITFPSPPFHQELHKVEANYHVAGYIYSKLQRKPINDYFIRAETPKCGASADTYYTYIYGP